MYLCWSLKGGSGTSVVAAALALSLGRRHPVLLVDLVGDQPFVLGLPAGDRPGVGDWFAADHDVGPEALTRLEHEIRPDTWLLPRGEGQLEGGSRAEVLAEALAGPGRDVVVDAGVVGAEQCAVMALGERARHRLLVTRACYLGLRRLADRPFDPTGVILITEPGRALGRADVEAVADAPVVAEVAWDPAVARSVDAGLLSSRLPRSLHRSLRAVR